MPEHNAPTPRSDPPGKRGRARFIVEVAIVATAAALLFLLWQIKHALILVFAGIVAAVIFSAVANPLQRFTRMPRAASVTVSILAVMSLLGLFGWLAMPQVQAQGAELLERLPDSLSELDRRIGSWLPEDAMADGGMMGTIAMRLANWSTSVVVAITTLVLVIAAGGFLAARPGTYRDGLVALLPPSRQDRVREALNRTGTALKAWLKAQLLSMLTIGAGVTLATWLIGLPSPFALGLIAGLFEFVPIIGPIAAAVPALLLALTISPAMVLWTGATYFAIEQIESNLILPIAQSEVADVPAALLIFAFVAIGAIFGIVGIIVSAPLTVALYALINDLYVEPLNRSQGA